MHWPAGPFCPYCGERENILRLGGVAGAKGQVLCRPCRKKFTVTVGTIFVRSHIPLHKWLLAFRLMASSKKGMSAHQLHRTLDITYKSAWFMAHRIREAMRDDNPAPIGGEGKIVEADETYFGHKEGQTKTRARKNKAMSAKRSVVALVERGGSVRSFHPQKANAENVRDILVRNASRKSRLMTDESRLYITTGKEYAGHETVQHSALEYVRGDVHTNTIEGYFSIFKRGMRGVYQHCSEKHLHRYLSEFGFRYNERSSLGVEDAERAAKAVKGGKGKRLTYRRTGEQEAHA